MRISVVIPCHNGSRFLSDALKSIEVQSRGPDEVILVADACTDDSVEIARLSSLPLRITECAYRNAAAARNHGVSFATGEWVAFLDADDFWYSTHLSHAEQLLEGSGDVAYLSHNDQVAFDSNGVGCHVQRDTEAPVTEPTKGLADVAFIEWWCRKAWFCTCSLVAKRSRLMEIGGFDPSQVRRHDFEMFFRLICGRRWTYDPRPGCVYRFRLNQGSVSSNVLETRFFTLRALVKNRALYDDVPVMNETTALWAHRTLRKILIEPDSATSDVAWQLAIAEVHPWLRPLYRVCRSQRVSVRRTYASVRALRRLVLGLAR